MSFLDKLFDQSTATDLATNGGEPVNVGAAAPPAGAGKILVTTDPTHAEWQDVPGGGGGGGPAAELATTGDPVNVSGAAPPVAGQTLIATDPDHAVWSDIGPSTLASLADAFANALGVEAVLVSNLTPLYGIIAVDDVGDGAETAVLVVGQSDPTENGFWITHDGDWIRALPLPADTAVGQVVIVGDGTEFAGSTWVYRGGDEWGQLSAGSPITGGDFMARTGNAIDLVGPISDSVHGNRSGGAQHAAATTTVSGFFTGAEKVKLAAIAANAAAVTSSAPTQITVTTAAAGVGASAARDDHVHSVATAAPAALTVGAVSAAGSSASLPRADHVHAMPGLATGSASGFISAADQDKLTSLPVSVKTPARLVSTSNIASLSGLLVVDGSTLVSNDRVLLVGQTTSSQNGIWVAASGSWTRAADADSVGDLIAGTIIPVYDGNNARTTWWLSTPGIITPGTTNISFTQAGGTKAIATPNAVTAGGGSGGPGGSNSWAPIDHVHKFPSPNLALNHFRISNNSSSIPQDITSATFTVVSHNGNKIALYSGSDWFDVEPLAPTINVTGQTAGVPFDVFAVFVGLTSMSIETVSWTNATTRATALVQFNGVWTKSGTQTRRYLGTILPDSATTFTHNANPAAGTKAVCGIWNQDNRIRSGFNWLAAAGTATPVTANVWATLPGMGGPHVELVLGQSIDAYAAAAIGTVLNGSITPISAIGIGVDSTSAVQGIRSLSTGVGATVVASLSASRTVKPTTPGVKNVNMLAQVSALGPSFYGNQDLAQSGLTVDAWF